MLFIVLVLRAMLRRQTNTSRQYACIRMPQATQGRLPRGVHCCLAQRVTQQQCSQLFARYRAHVVSDACRSKQTAIERHLLARLAIGSDCIMVVNNDLTTSRVLYSRARSRLCSRTLASPPAWGKWDRDWKSVENITPVRPFGPFDHLIQYT